MAELNKQWYVKHRPDDMSDYSGDAIKKIVTNRFRVEEDMPHVIMIHGVRGCGKTTLARILTKYYLCENRHEDGTPCNKCSACIEINETLLSGNTELETSGVVEVDATTENGKNAIQDALEDAIIPPMYTKYKILIFDECHEITRAAQNSMLKILEDIPPHLVVIFATTNPEGVLPTIHSRCQLKIEARKQSLGDMVKRLMTISQLERLEVSSEALEIIAKKNDRVPRECINALETIAKTYSRKVTLDTVREYYADTDNTEKFLEFIQCANSSLEDVLQFVASMKDQDIKFEEFATGLLSFVLDAMYIKFGVNIDQFTLEYVKEVKSLFKTYESQDFDLLLQILEKLEYNLRTSKDNQEIQVIIAAMRIGKIKLLSNGLSNSLSDAINENKISMFEHSKLLEERKASVEEQLKMSITPAMMKEEFSDVSIVADNVSFNLALNPVDLDAMKEDKVKLSERKNTDNADIDDFFS